MTFAMALALKPASAQKRKKTRYKQNLRDAAINRIGGAKTPLLDGQLYARITWFHAEEPKLDVDNIVKPILDALIGVVYDDDQRIAQCLVDSLSVMVSGMRVVGNGVVTVGLENGYLEKKEEDWQFDFPLSFDVELDHDLDLKVVHDIATDTSSFYASHGRSALLVDGEQV